MGKMQDTFFLKNLQQYSHTEHNILHPDDKHEMHSSSKVHVNPNFRNGKNLVIHVNPRMHQNRKIHVNPKMMKDIGSATVQEPLKIEPIQRTNDITSCNERLSTDTDKNTKKSIHVNPKLMGKLRCDPVQLPNVQSSLPPPTESDKLDHSNFVQKDSQLSPVSAKVARPRLMALSRRKLVRIDATAKKTIARLPDSEKKLIRRTSLVRVNLKKSKSSCNSIEFASMKNKYKIDKTVASGGKPKKNCIPTTSVRNVNKGLVAIGGVMYRSSRTRLVRSNTDSSSVKTARKDATSTNRGAFVMAKNGKKLQRLYTAKDGSSVTRYVVLRQNSLNRRALVKKVPNSIVQTSHKNVISYKAKQRSLQILRDKLRKNYIPCLLYRRFGYCAKYANGTCSKLHDKKQVSLCKNFLQGKCLLDDCPLSHDIGPEKMPTCKYFLDGCCIRDACPYLHVKVSSNTPICAQFLRGYCADGNKCKQRHAYLCPEFERSGSCAKSKYCPYPHKVKAAAGKTATLGTTKSRVSKEPRTSSRRKVAPVHNESSKVIPITASNEGTKKRYYEKTSPSDELLFEMRENIIKKMNLARKANHEVSQTAENTVQEEIRLDGSQVETEVDCNHDGRPTRAPIGHLPSYIPID